MKIKKFFCFCITAMICLGSFMFVGCGNNETSNASATTVMNMSINPEVEFILDGDGKVITVNALNEDGNLIIASSYFDDIVGKSAQEAGTIFVQASKDYGFIVSGNFQTEDAEIEVSFSADDETINSMYENLKENIENFLSTENITATITKAEQITKEKLQELVEECAPYLEKAEIVAMEQAELIRELANSRKETAEFYSQQLKKAYYDSKAYVLEQAEFEALKEHLTEIQKVAFEIEYFTYTQSIEAIETIRLNYLVGENSTYQRALNTLRERKAEYLAFREELSKLSENEINELALRQLENLESAFEKAEDALIEANESVVTMLDTAKESIEQNHSRVMEQLQSLNSSSYVSEISAKQQEKLNEFYTNFENTYKSAKDAINQNIKNFQTAVKGESSN